MTAAFIRRPGTYVIGPDRTLAQCASTHVITCSGETPAQALDRLAAEQWPEGTQFEFVFSQHRLGCVRASTPADKPLAQLRTIGPVLAVLQAMATHGFGSTTFQMTSGLGLLAHRRSSITLDSANLDAELQRLAQSGDELHDDGRVARLVRWAWSLVG